MKLASLSRATALSRLKSRIVRQDLSDEQVLELVRCLRKASNEFNLVQADFNLFGRRFFHYQCILKGEDGKSHAGHGRSEIPTQSLTKSLNEAVERISMHNFFSSDLTLPGFKALIDSSGEIEVMEEAEVQPPSPGLRSSNGWAVDVDLKTSVLRAALEALERDILQRCFWAGFKTLNFVKSHFIDQFKINLYNILNLPKNLEVLVASVESDRFSGLTFGHQAQITNEPNWEHSIIEAVQIAESFLLTAGQPSTSPFDRIQFDFANDLSIRSQIENRPQKSVPPPLEVPVAVEVLVFDLAKTLGLPFELYCCWVTSDNLLPLYIESLLSPEEKQHMLNRCTKLGLSGPFLQGPFV